MPNRFMRAFLVWLLVLPSQMLAQPVFSDLSDSLPIQHVYDGGWEYYVGGGVAVFDCNDDGYPDIFAAGGAGASQLFLNQTPAVGEAITFAVAKPSDHTLNDVTGAYPIDIDGDGKLDLFVMRVGPNAVLRGLGDCAFERAEDTWRIDPGTGWTTAFSAGWGPGDDWPTLAVGNYVDRRDPEGPFGTCDDHQILRPNGSGFGAPELITPGYCTLSMLFTDWSGGGQQDLWISNDRHYYVHDGQEQLIRVWPELSFYDAADGWATSKLWGMGIASRDITGDARPEIAITSMADQKLFQLDEDVDQPSFASIAYDRGTTAHVPYMGEEGRPSTGWHVQFGDVDNDGLDDLFIAKGNVNQMPGMATRDPDNLLMQQQDGQFIETGETAGIGSFERGRGGALLDLNRDGLLDLVVVQRRAELKLYQNTTGETGNWVQLRLSQDGGNRNAIGARIEIMSGDHHQFRELLVGGGHAGGQAGFEHFGLGTATSARLRVRWPDGTMGPWYDVLPNTHLNLKAGAVPVPDGRTGGAQTPPAIDQ